MKNITLVICLLIQFAVAFGQQPTPKKCGSDTHLKKWLQANPENLERYNKLESFTREYVKNSDGSLRTVITIPVVFHIMWHNQEGDISNQTVYDQLEQLNDDYNSIYDEEIPDYFLDFAANCEIHFELATKGPDDKATNGIRHIYTENADQWEYLDQIGYDPSDDVKFSDKKGDSGWDPAHYLNIWVCKLNGWLGYSSFPAEAETSLDGIVIDNNHFGGGQRTLTHEAGHYLNLIHIWGNDEGQVDKCSADDGCEDTPKQEVAKYGCPTGIVPDNCTGLPHGIMYMNYMDYTDDACQSLFTKNQKCRMTCLFDEGGARVDLLSSHGLEAGNGIVNLVPKGLGNSEPTYHHVTLYWDWVENRCARKYEVRYKPTDQADWFTITTRFNETKHHIRKIKDGKSWEWQVRANYDGGLYSEWSDVKTFTTPLCPQGDPTCNHYPRRAEPSTVTTEIVPNPSNGNFHFNFNCEQESDVLISIYDITGKKIFDKEVLADAGSNSTMINLDDMNEGIYILELNDDGLLSRIKFMVSK